MTPQDYRNLRFREYLPKLVIGDAEACERIHRKLAFRLKEWLDSRNIAGYKVRNLKDEEDFIEEDINFAEILNLTHDLLPVVWLNVTFVPPQFTDNQRTLFETEFDLILIKDGALFN